MRRGDRPTGRGRVRRITSGAVALTLLASLGLTLAAPPVDAVVGGKTVRSISDAPWIAQVISWDVCTGSVIASHWVLTAAHCVVDPSGHKVRGGYVVRSLKSAVPPASPGAVFPNTAVVIPPKYHGSGSVGPYDIALIYSKAAIAGPYLHLAGPKDISRWKPKAFATLFGYGEHSDNDQAFRPLTKKRIRILSDAKMAALGFGWPYYAPAVNLGTPGDNACYGDSGGPLVIGSRTAAKIVGVVNYGRGKCSSNIGNVYAEVGYRGTHPLWSWIRKTVLSPRRA
jgi:hypothetical protein